MASNETPSMPGAPLFALAMSYAARSVSILQTWTYSPQKRQDGSAFALTYSLRLRSCNSMDAFIISSLPSLCWRHHKWQGHWDRNRARSAVGEGFPFLLFRLQDGFTVPPWLTFPEAPL